MTTKDFPRKLSPAIRTAWLGEQYGGPDRQPEDVPDNRAPDRWGATNPDDDTTRLEWDTDLTAQEEADFDDMVTANGGDSDAVPGAAGAADAVRTMRAFRERTGAATNAQRDSTIDAIIDYIRFRA